MTTYAYRVSLNDSEVIIVEQALTHYREFLKSQPAGQQRTYLIDRVMERLHSNTEMTSTSSFCYPAKPPNESR
jgi:hypothetical protein